MEELVKHINDIKEKIDFVEYDNLNDAAGAVIGDREHFKSLCSELKAENKALKEVLEKAEAKLFITVRNNIVGEAVGDVDVIALMIIRNFDGMIDFEKAIKSKAEAEARLKELKGEKE